MSASNGEPDISRLISDVCRSGLGKWRDFMMEREPQSTARILRDAG